ncbi:hypothetical protein [Methylobacterium sp. 77]|uniref:hypothetical protein n=1 Tax=Methylobacterium sp. 77 TaxID=1101192 RepID=UPI000377099A|nr:hypothetical protein [Methylobacterium sp. 77]
MIRLSTVVTLSALLVTGTAAVALAQSYGAPSGRDAATAPGGTEGIAGPRNEAEAIRSGDAVPVPPGAGGIPAEEPQMQGRDKPMHTAPPRP